MGTMSLPLTYHPALEQPDLLAPPVAAALRSLPWADQVRVAAIDPALADTAQFCETYGVTLEESANCVVIAAKRGSDVTYAACMVAATTRSGVRSPGRSWWTTWWRSRRAWSSAPASAVPSCGCRGTCWPTFPAGRSCP